jgi:pimeloyl-ACP methyl ester carboxylesterase
MRHSPRGIQSLLRSHTPEQVRVGVPQRFSVPNAKLAVYPGSGHGGIFQYHEVFVQQALDFLRD